MVNVENNSAGALSRRPCREYYTHCHKVEALADIKQVRAAVAAAVCDPATLRTEQLNKQVIGPIVEEVEAGQCPVWKDIADHSPTYKSYWA
jgi:hypothetical protein